MKKEINFRELELESIKKMSYNEVEDMEKAVENLKLENVKLLKQKTKFSIFSFLMFFVTLALLLANSIITAIVIGFIFAIFATKFYKIASEIWVNNHVIENIIEDVNAYRMM